MQSKMAKYNESGGNECKYMYQHVSHEIHCSMFEGLEIVKASDLLRKVHRKHWVDHNVMISQCICSSFMEYILVGLGASDPPGVTEVWRLVILRLVFEWKFWFFCFSPQFAVLLESSITQPVWTCRVWEDTGVFVVSLRGISYWWWTKIQQEIFPATKIKEPYLHKVPIS